MKSLAKLIGKLPFAGKMSVRRKISALYQSTTAGARRQNYLYFMVFLAIFVLLHAVQACMGIETMSFDAPLWVRGIGAFYATVNICVSLTQVYLGFRATRFCLCAPYPRTVKKDDGFTDAQATAMVAVTLGGQILFLLLYLRYK